jgi:hypothetical protein
LRVLFQSRPRGCSFRQEPNQHAPQPPQLA